MDWAALRYKHTAAIRAVLIKNAPVIVGLENSDIIANTAQILTAPEVLVQATSWHRNAQGKIELVADKSPNQVQQPLTCAAVPKS